MVPPDLHELSASACIVQSHSSGLPISGGVPGSCHVVSCVTLLHTQRFSHPPCTGGSLSYRQCSWSCTSLIGSHKVGNSPSDSGHSAKGRGSGGAPPWSCPSSPPSWSLQSICGRLLLLLCFGVPSLILLLAGRGQTVPYIL